MNFTGYLPQQNPQLFPQQQIVVPPITIPQGFAPKYTPQTVVQMTARGKEAAKNIPLGPNSKVAIFEEDPDQSIFYYRETDAYGNDIAFSVNSFSEIEEPAPPKYLTEEQFNLAMESFMKQIKEEMANGKPVREESATAAE